MVQFRIKTIATQDCTIDAAYADLYDGKSQFLKVGGSIEPKKSLLRFDIAEKPVFGDAEITHAELGIYTSGVTKGTSSQMPQYNVYKMKSSANGQDWGATGRIRKVPRGKKITKVNATDRQLEVLDHQLFTGDAITYTPYVNYYDDCDIGTSVKPEAEYYVVRINRDLFGLTTTLALAMSYTQASDLINLDAATTNVETLGSDTPGAPAKGDTHYGYIRNEKYNQDIHIVTAWHDDGECLSENFNGSQYRETDLDFELTNRTVTRRGSPYLTGTNLKNKLQDTITSTLQNASSNSDLLSWYGEASTVAELGRDRRVYLKSHKTNADGSGWWRTSKKGSWWEGKYDYCPKTQADGTKNPNVIYDDEILTGAVPYGNEVTPMNCFFNTVRGAAEFQQAGEDENSDNELQATGVVRFSTKKVLTGGQSMNIYQFWKQDALGVKYDGVAADDPSGRQECVVVRKDIPWAPFQGIITDYDGVQEHAPDVLPTSGAGAPSNDGSAGAYLAPAAVNYSPNQTFFNVTMMIEKLEYAYAMKNTDFYRSNVAGGKADTADAEHDRLYQSRGITMIWADSAPLKGESLYRYMARLGTAAGAGESSLTDGNADEANSAVNQGSRWGSETGHGATGFTLLNTDSGIKIMPLTASIADKTLQDWFWADVPNQKSSAIPRGNNSYGSGYPSSTSELDYRSAIQEGEWATYRVHHSTAGTFAGLYVEDAEGINIQNLCSEDDERTDSHVPLVLTKAVDDSVTYATDGAYPAGHAAIGIDAGTLALKGGFRNCDRIAGGTPAAGSGSNAKEGTWWGKNFSLWVSNRKTDFSTAASTVDSGTDWMAEEEDRDCETNIFVDSISYTGINQSHSNSTLGQVGSAVRDKIGLSSGKMYNRGSYGTYSTSGVKMSVGNRRHRSDINILLGFEDPSQISSDYARKKSWRYLYFQDYTSANLSKDGPLIWTAGGTLPQRDGDTSAVGLNQSSGLVAGTTKWFTDVKGPATNARTTAHGNHEILDYGLPFVYTDFLNDILGTTTYLVPSIQCTYSEANSSLGHQWNKGTMDYRELYMNRTAGHTQTDTAAISTAGEQGANLPMFITAPPLGVIYNTSTAIINANTLTVRSQGGPKDSADQNEHNWITGHKVVYYDNGETTITGLTSSKGDFTDVPGDNAGTYYVIAVSATTFKLAISRKNAIALTPITISETTSNKNHIFYDYEYYVNKKYYTNGFSQKGFNRLILQPVNSTSSASSTTFSYIKHEYLAPTGAVVEQDVDEKLLLTKREHISCAAKLIEILDTSTAYQSSSTSSDLNKTAKAGMKVRVDTVEPLRSTEGTTYRLFMPMSGLSTAYYKSGLDITIIDGETIEIHGYGGQDDAGGNLLTGALLSELWISPEKYWLYMNVRAHTGDTKTDTRGTPSKSYGAVVIVSPSGGTTEAIEDEVGGNLYDGSLYDAWGTPGATYNESTANFDAISGINGAYINKWLPELNMDKNKTIFDLSDFGFGPAKEDKDNLGGENGVLGGYVASFIPRGGQVNYIPMLKVLGGLQAKQEGDTLDLAIAAETSSTDGIVGIASTDNTALPRPFLLTVFEDEKPEAPADFDVEPNEKDAFLPDFTWTAGDSDLWYGFIMIDDVPINNQYHRSVLHVPLQEDLRNVASTYDDTKGWFYTNTSTPLVYGYRYYNTASVPTGVHAGLTLQTSSERVSASRAILYDNVEGLAGNTKYFDFNDNTYVQFPFSNTPGNSEFTYPIDEMSVIVHITPDSWAGTDQQRYIAAFNAPTDNTLVADAWGIYLDVNGQINAYIHGTPASSTPSDSLKIELKSTTKVPIDGTPTCVILTVDTQLHSGNVKLFINGRLEDQTGLRKTTGSTNNWATDAAGLGGVPIFYDTDGTEDLFIGAKSQQSASNTKATASFTFTSVATLDSTIQLIDGAGTPVQRVYQFKDSVTSGTVDGANIHVNRGSTFSDSASELKTAIDHANGHNGSIVVTISDGSVSLQQSTAGSHNTTITLDQHSGVDITTSTSPNPPATFTGGDTDVKNSFKGRIEEFVWYDKCIYPIMPQNGKFTLDKPLEELADDLSSSSSKAYTARLFIKDYHNIRGKTTGEVAASSQLSFKKAAFELNTVV